jgi:hypothetical protein
MEKSLNTKMLRFYQLHHIEDNFYYEINIFSGNLLKSEHLSPKNQKIPTKIVNALYYINFPFELNWCSIPKFKNLPSKHKKQIDKQNNFFFWLCKKSFFLSILYSFVNRSKFSSTSESFSYVSTLKNHHRGSENCLQRCLLAAKISSSFKKNGVLFIGFSSSSKDMHAWIIEGNVQPDFDDRVWINYKPLLAITF